MNSTLFEYWWTIPIIISCGPLHFVVRANKKAEELKRPDYVADDIRCIDYKQLWREGVRTLVFDVNNTLCPTWKEDLYPWVLPLLAEIKGLGFTIWLASKSNPFMESIEELVRPYAKVYFADEHNNVKKPSRQFFEFFLCIRSDKRTKVAFIGDKLTDMGRNDMLREHLAVSVLTNKLGRDLISEYLIFRRSRERMVQDSMHIKRAKKGEFRKTEPQTT